MPSIAEALAVALQCHQAGRLPEAEQIYRQILAVEPNHADALHLLGVIAHQQGKCSAAVEYIERAIGLNGRVASYHLNLGNVWKDQGKFNTAVACYQRALQLNPRFGAAHNNLGNALKELGMLDEAADCYRRALELQPGNSGAHNNLAAVLKDQGKLDEAITCWRRALEIDPRYAEVHNNLGVACKDQGMLEEAVSCYRRALELKPDFADAHNNLGVALTHQGILDEAVACCRCAVELKPRAAEPHNNLGNALRERGKLREAIASYRRALDLRPEYAEALNNLGNGLKEDRQPDEAVACYRRAIELRPDYAEAINNLGVALKDQGMLDEAISCCRRALEARPDLAEVHSNLLYAQIFSPDYDARLFQEEHRRWNLRHAVPLAQHIQPHANDRSPHRRLRVGYVSPDFRDHCQALFTVPLFLSHDHENFDIICYADVLRPDAITERLKSHADVWRNIVGLDHQRVAEMIREDRIDILVDLTMHMARNRLLVFARKPAPVQVCWLAYPGTTGLSTIDYRITDPYLDPPGLDDGCYSEESIRLPDAFWCYDPLASQPDVSPLPAAERGHITFGCLNNFCKLNAGVLKIWAEVLIRVEDSRLVILADEGAYRQRTLDLLAAEGITGDRMTFVARQGRPQYLQYYHGIDIGLDTVPYNGHTTSLDALWMGVPVVTLVGPTVVGRAGLCQLVNLGLSELIASSPEQFVRIAAELARDLPRLGGLRATLRNRMRASPLMDAARFARNLESTYRAMWQRWCTSE
jgi:protein O-GlcNAc transferase